MLEYVPLRDFWHEYGACERADFGHCRESSRSCLDELFVYLFWLFVRVYDECDAFDGIKDASVWGLRLVAHAVSCVVHDVFASFHVVCDVFCGESCHVFLLHVVVFSSVVVVGDEYGGS